MRPSSAARDEREQSGIRYLLGLLPEEEHARVERALLEDDAAFEQMAALEDELFHEYVQGGLDPAEQRRFEERYLASDEGRRRLADARGLLAQIGGRAPRRSWLLPLAAVLVLGAGAWLLGRREVSPATPVAVSSPAAPIRRVALALAPGVTRDVAGVARRVRLSPEDGLVLTLSLPVTATPSRLQARVVSAEGRQLWRAGALTARSSPDGPVVILEVPPGALPEGDYQLLLAADAPDAAEVADYAFTVLRR